MDPAPRTRRGLRSVDGDGDALDAEEFFEARVAAFFAHPADADAAERAICREARRPVDQHLAGLQLGRDPVCPGQIPGLDVGGEAVSSAVRDGNRLLVGGELGDRQHRAEHLVLRQLRGRVDISEHGRLDVEPGAVHPLPAGHQSSPSDEARPIIPMIRSAAAWLITGAYPVARSAGSPALIALTSVLIRSTTWSWIARGEDLAGRRQAPGEANLLHQRVCDQAV